MSEKKNSLALNFIYKFGLSFFKIAFPILVMPYVYRQISPQDMGLVGFVLTTMMYFYIIGDFGMYIYGFREVILLKQTPKKLSNFFTETFIIRGFLNLVALISYVLFIYFFKINNIDSVFYLIAGIQILGTFVNVEWFFEGTEEFRFITIKTIIVRIIATVLIFIYVNGESEIASKYYLLFTSLFLLVNNLVSFIFLLRKKPFSFIKLKELNFFSHLKKMFYIFCTINAIVFFFQLDKLILGINGDLIGVSFYGLSEKIIIIIGSLLFSVVTVVAPRLGEALLNNISDYKIKIKELMKIISFILFPITFFTFSSSVEILSIIGGDEYKLSKTLFQYFSLYLISYTLLEIIKTNVLILFRKEKVFFIIIMIIGCINTIFKLIFGSVLDANLVLLITLFLSLLVAFLLIVYVYKYLKIVIIDKYFFKYCFLSFPILLLNFFYYHSVVSSLIIKIIVTAVYYISLMLLLNDKVFNEIVMPKIKKLIFKK